MRERDAKAAIVEELLQHRIFVVEVEGDGHGAVTAVEPVADLVAAALAVGHEQRVVLEGGVAALHADFAVDGFDIDGLDVEDLEGHAVDIWQLLALWVDLPVIGVAHEFRWSRWRRLGHDPGPDARAFGIAVVVAVGEVLIPEVLAVGTSLL